MTEYEASRTLVKSPPELWAELSDEVSLAGHLAEPFGEIKITRLEPETAVAWEGERASGTVRIESSGWGTRVTLTARAVEADSPKSDGQLERPDPRPDPPPPRPAPPAEPLPPAAVAPPAAAEPGPPAGSEAPRRGLRGLLRGWRTSKSVPVVAEAPPARAETPSEPAETPLAPAEAPSEPAVDHDAILVGVLDRLGAAHHRPFSRS
jgi:hypothetical protein